MDVPTYQGFVDAVAAGNTEKYILSAIRTHQASDMYKTAVLADLYDHQQNKTINDFMQVVYTLSGAPLENYVASNAKIASNFFARLNVQRNTYSLGNGVTFSEHVIRTVDADGVAVTRDKTKEMLGPKFDTDLLDAGYYALIHGVVFVYWDIKRMFLLRVTEFVPLWDEESGDLRAGIRFKLSAAGDVLYITLFEADGVTKYQSAKGDLDKIYVSAEKQAYKVITAKAQVDPEPTLVSAENYGVLPIVPFWGSRLKQSTLVGLQQKIDSYDLIRSGFANDLSDCSQIYWILENYGGMTDDALNQFRQQLLFTHTAAIDTTAGGKVSPHTVEPPYQARNAFLSGLRAEIYEGFGGLDVHTIAAGATNDHIDAAYQPLDENADDYEIQIIDFVQRLLEILGIQDTPIFKRNRISNQKEQVEIIAMEAALVPMDPETLLSKFPNITPDEIPSILARMDMQERDRLEDEGPEDGGAQEGGEKIEVDKTEVVL